MIPSNEIRTFIENKEAFRDSAYIPVAGDRPTIGFGSTFYSDGTPVKLGDTISLDDAIVLLNGTINDIAKDLDSITSSTCTQNQFDAVLSLCYNVGMHAFCTSTSGTMFSRGQDISHRFILWDESGGQVIPGLQTRRLQEKEIYLNGNYTT